MLKAAKVELVRAMPICPGKYIILIKGKVDEVQAAVKAGQKVKRGDLIGYVGSTGVSAGSHLHYEVWKKGEKVNPVHYFYNDLSPKEFEEVIEVASRFNQCLS